MSQTIQQEAAFEVLQKLATVCYVVVPGPFLKKFIHMFPCQDGDFVIGFSELQKDVFQVQVYVTQWHSRESQVLYLLEQERIIRARGYECFRHWYAYAERKDIRKNV